MKKILLIIFILTWLQAGTKPRARDLGFHFDGSPGPLNAITDVSGVQVGHTTLIESEGKLVQGILRIPEQNYRTCQCDIS